VYIFVVMEIASRRIVLVNVTTSPSLGWVKQQLRQATAWGESPRFLVQDNDGIFGQFRDRKRRGEKARRYRCHLDVWLADALRIEGSRSRTARRMPARTSNGFIEPCAQRHSTTSSS